MLCMAKDKRLLAKAKDMQDAGEAPAAPILGPLLERNVQGLKVENFRSSQFSWEFDKITLAWRENFSPKSNLRSKWGPSGVWGFPNMLILSCGAAFILSHASHGVILLPCFENDILGCLNLGQDLVAMIGNENGVLPLGG